MLPLHRCGTGLGSRPSEYRAYKPEVKPRAAADRLSQWLDQVFKYGDVGELEVQSYGYESIEEAKLITARADRIDNKASRPFRRTWKFTESEPNILAWYMCPDATGSATPRTRNRPLQTTGDPERGEAGNHPV